MRYSGEYSTWGVRRHPRKYHEPWAFRFACRDSRFPEFLDIVGYSVRQRYDVMTATRISDEGRRTLFRVRARKVRPSLYRGSMTLERRVRGGLPRVERGPEALRAAKNEYARILDEGFRAVGSGDSFTSLSRPEVPLARAPADSLSPRL